MDILSSLSSHDVFSFGLPLLHFLFSIHVLKTGFKLLYFPAASHTAPEWWFGINTAVKIQKLQLESILKDSLTLAPKPSGSLLMVDWACGITSNQLINQSINHPIHSQPCVNESDTAAAETDADRVQSMTSSMIMKFDITGSVLAVFAVMFLGTFSTSLGRKAQLLIPISGYTVRALSILAVAFWDLDLSWLYVGCVAEGIMGGVSARWLSTVSLSVCVYDSLSFSLTLAFSRSLSLSCCCSLARSRSLSLSL